MIGLHGANGTETTYSNLKDTRRCPWLSINSLSIYRLEARSHELNFCGSRAFVMPQAWGRGPECTGDTAFICGKRFADDESVLRRAHSRRIADGEEDYLAVGTGSNDDSGFGEEDGLRTGDDLTS